MRIAVVNSIRVCGGGEKWLVRQASCWKQEGHEPLILCQPGADLQRLCRDAGLPTQAVEMRHDVSLPAVAGLAGALRRFRPDVVLCCNERAFRLAVPARLSAGKPPVIYRNGLSATFKNRAHNRLLFGAVSRMVVNTGALRDEMTAFGWIPRERVQVIQNGIDAEIYRPDPEARARVRAEVGSAPDAVVAAVVARVTEDKGQVETIEALASLAGDFPQAELWIVGEGSLRPVLEAQAQAAGLADRVRFLGFRRDVPAVLQAVDILVQASHREGLGNSLLEAMASRRPVIASTVGGNPDVVVPGVTGELVPPYDAAAIASALRPLLAGPELRARYGEAGWQRVQDHFRLEREAQEWSRLFEQVTGAPHGRLAGASVARPNDV